MPRISDIEFSAFSLFWRADRERKVAPTGAVENRSFCLLGELNPLFPMEMYRKMSGCDEVLQHGVMVPLKPHFSLNPKIAGISVNEATS